ncbi:protein FAM110A isoform X1 [Anas acuta]|uniref:protein FAM110A isoform X1 n=2 Tax=Anas acuta TaxID=28680 RepID=UPI0035C8FA85
MTQPQLKPGLAWRKAPCLRGHAGKERCFQSLPSTTELPRRASSSPGGDSEGAVSRLAEGRPAPVPPRREQGRSRCGDAEVTGPPSHQGTSTGRGGSDSAGQIQVAARAPRAPRSPPQPARTMPVEALSAGDATKGAAVAAPFTSAMPIRILNKGPEYFRRRLEPGARKPSAVERLEADKAKYVKSQQVASTKQEPVKPPLLKQPLFAPAVRRAMLTPSRKTPPGPRRSEAGATKTSLNLEILNNLINICDSPFPKAESPRGREWPCKAEMPSAGAEGAGKAPESPAATKPPGTVAVRRVDVRPCGALPSRVAPTGQVTPVALSPAPGRLPTAAATAVAALSSPNRPESARRQTLLHRSKSDLSDRFSRATADLERFFNYCGLDPEEVRDMGAEHFARASSDIVSVKFHSVSTASSEGGRSPRSAATPEGRPAERMPYGISVVERNARVIKWLYGLRQAREPQQVSNV